MCMDRQIETFINKFVEELAEENAALFAGAGLSVAAGFVDWKGLLQPIAQELGLDLDKEHDLISVAQYHCNEKGGNRHQLNQHVIDEFCRSLTITENHRILARLPIRTFWTTNYDRLIEKALEFTGRVPDTKYTVKQLAVTKRKRDAVIYKMHGDVDHPDDAVITKDDYERYSSDHGPFITALSGDLVSKTFLFLGFSFTDPNLDYILSRIRVTFTSGQRQHYCIMKKRLQLSGETPEAHQYAALKQELAIKDLKRFNVQALLVDQYSDITGILRAIEDRYRQKTVLISGSAHEYGSFQKPEAFIANLSQALIAEGCKVVSGFGLGVGGHVIVGTLRQIYDKQGQQLHDQLILRPFPQGGPDIQARWEAYRQEMVAYAGVALFVFGNKLDTATGTVALANGVRREFEIAHQRGLKVIPVGVTGYMAEDLWREVLADFDTYYPGRSALKPLFEELGKPADSAVLIAKVVEIIRQLRGS